MPHIDLRKLRVLAAFLFPIIVVFDKNFISVYLVVLLGATAYLVRPYSVRLWAPLVGTIGALALLCLLSALWSIDPAHSAIRFIRLGLALAGGVLLCALAAARETDGREAAMTGLAVGMLVAGAITLVCRYAPPLVAGGPVETFLRAMPILSYGAVAVFLIFVLAATMAERPVPILVPGTLAFAVPAVVLSGNAASTAALAAGIAAAAFFFWLGRKAVLAAAVILPLLFLALPMTVHNVDLAGYFKARGWMLDHSATHRLIIGRYVMGKIEERPILGWGLNSSRILPDRDGQVFGNPRYADLLGLTNFAPWTKIELMPMHPHNATLQTWLEVGALGPIIYAALYALILVGMNRIVRSRLALAAGGGAVVAAFVIGQLSFNVWQSWWVIMQFLAAALFLYVVPKTRPAGNAGQHSP